MVFNQSTVYQNSLETASKTKTLDMLQLHEAAELN